MMPISPINLDRLSAPRQGDGLEWQDETAHCSKPFIQAPCFLRVRELYFPSSHDGIFPTRVGSQILAKEEK
jgi:hypothetical protein